MWANERGNGKIFMSGPDFLDTNVLVYAYDTNHPEKQRVARQLLKSGIAGKAVISTQVLAEFAATLLHKISIPASADAVMKGLDAMAPIRLVTPDAEADSPRRRGSRVLWHSFLRWHDCRGRPARRLRANLVGRLKSGPGIFRRHHNQSVPIINQL